MNRLNLLFRNFHHIFIAIDQLLGCLLATIIGIFNGTHKAYADETISSFLWREKKRWYVNVFRVAVDVIAIPFMHNGLHLTHCQKSYEHELNRTQSSL